MSNQSYYSDEHYRVTKQVSSLNLCFFFLRVSLVQENYFLYLIFFLLLSLYSFSTLFFNLSLSKTVQSISSRLSFPLLYNRNPRLCAAVEFFLVEVQERVVQPESWHCSWRLLHYSEHFTVSWRCSEKPRRCSTQQTQKDSRVTATTQNLPAATPIRTESMRCHARFLTVAPSNYNQLIAFTSKLLPN